MRAGITIGYFLLVLGAGIFLYGATRHATTNRLTLAATSAAREIFWSEGSPVPIREHMEFFPPVNYFTYEMLGNLGGERFCWGTGAFEAYFVGLFFFFLGAIIIRYDILKRCSLVDSQSADVARVRRAGLFVLLFRAGAFVCVAVALIVIGFNFQGWWGDKLEGGRIPQVTLTAFALLNLVNHWFLPSLLVLSPLLVLDRFLYLRILRSQKRHWRWLWEMPFDWCLGFVFLSLFLGALCLPFYEVQQWTSVNTLISPSTQAQETEKKLSDLFQSANLQYSFRTKHFSRAQVLAAPKWREWEDWLKSQKDEIPEEITMITVSCKEKDKPVFARLFSDFTNQEKTKQ
jgi:hypothetical protein